IQIPCPQREGYSCYKVGRKGRDHMEEHSCKEIQVKTECAPCAFQLPAQHIVEIEGKDHEDIAALGRLYDKGHDPPELSVQDGAYIQRKILIIKGGGKK